MNDKSISKWNISRIFRLIGKSLLILICFVISLLLISVIAVQFKSVRQFALEKLLDTVTSKTNSIITADDLHFYFNGFVDLNGLFVGDEKGDTILAAGNISFRIGLMDLVEGDINLHNVELSETTVNLVKTDSIFNFTFILEKLSSKKISTDTASTGDSSEFSIDHIRMQDCRFTFIDNTSGTDVAFSLKEMDLAIDSLDLKVLKFSLDKFNLSGAVAEIKLNPSNAVVDTSVKTPLPVFIIRNMNMDNFTFSLDNKVDNQKVYYSTVNSQLESVNINLNDNYFSLESIISKNTILTLANNSKGIKEVENANTGTSALHLKVNQIVFVNNEIEMSNSALKSDANKFNTSNFQLSELNGQVLNLIFSMDSIHAVISGLTTYLDREKDPIEVSGSISKYPNTITASTLNFRHGQTELKGELFASFDFSAGEKKLRLKNSDLELSKVIIDQNDLMYFLPDSIEKKYFSEKWPSLEFAVKAKGNSEKMVVSRFNLISGSSTTLESNFTLKNIDNPEFMGFDIEKFDLRTSRNDLEAIPVHGLIPASLNIPEAITLKTSGKGTIRNFKLKTDIITSTGNLNLIVSRINNKNFEGNLKVDDFNVGRLLKMEDQVGQVSLKVDFKGSGTSADDINADINLAASSLVYNKYNYHDLTIIGKIAGKTFSGVIELNDTNAELKIDGLVDLNVGKEKIKTSIDIQGINLKNLNFTTEDIRFSSNANIDFNGLKYDSLTGTMAVHNIVIVKNENIYRLDSLLFASVNDSLGNNTKMESAILSADFRGAFSPANLMSEIRNLTNRYFPISDTMVTGNRNDFSFNIYLRNHPVIRDVFLPKLEEFSTIEMKGNFNKKEDVFNATLTLPYLKYSGMKLENFVFDLKSDSVAVVGNMGFKELSNVQFKVDSLNVNVLLRDSTMKLSMLNLNGEEKKLSFSADVIANSAKDYLLLLPGSFILNSEEWLADGSDSIHLRKDLPVTVNIDISKQEEHVQIERDINGNGKVVFKGFRIENLFQLVSRDSTLASGVLNGDIILADKSLSGIINLNEITVKKHPIGDIFIKANQLPNGFAFNSKLEGNDNLIEVSGDISSANEVSVLNIIADLKSISMKSIEALSMGNLSASAGNISGNIKISGTSAEPDLEGKLVFNNVETTPTSINSRFSVPNSTLAIENKKLLFNKFAMRDSEGQDLIVDGFIDVSNMTNPDLSVSISSEEFELFNSPKAQKKMFYGRLIADSKIDITGNLEQPFIKARLGVKKGTDFTFAIPKAGGQSDRGGEEVIFKLDKLNSILTSGDKAEIGKSDLRNVTVESILEIDKGAILRIIPDPDSGDSLIVQGAAALNFGLDRTGRMSLTGSYELEDGSYVVSLENLVKKRFKIQQGSRIDWNGDPLNAEIDLRAMYEVRTSPADLLANEFASNSSTDNEYKERLPFQVFLYLKGDLKAPVISFEIQLPAGSRGALGGMVNEKLLLLNNDPSELNKQVFALLVLNRFIQEDPLASSGEGSAAENAARSSVSRFLSNQLNKLSSQYISGVELDFDLQSYNDYGSNSGEGRTELAVGIKKNINDRISVQVGGSVEVEGARAKENSLSDWTGDFTVEYKLTEDGEYRLKGFRRNQYEGLVEGQLVETGIGILFVKDFDLWKDLFKKNTVKEKGYESPEDK